MSSLRPLLSVPRLAMLRRYFYSGWAFLVPYLAVYLLYYVTKWQVNPAGESQNPELQIPNGWVPCLLHVYWALHAIHAILAGFALWSWWLSYRSTNRGPNANCQESDCATPDLATSDVRHPTSNLWPLVVRLLPWLLLALLFYIPGVYLEWPSDPWEHLRRINEWRILDTVGAHSSWTKSAYFIPYSLLSWCIGLRQLFWLDFYYTGICLLLCWQYYRFSRVCGLGERASMVFVIIQALLFGNNIFSFYRYYGISSSIYAQLGAIALTRIFLEWAAIGTKLDPVLRKDASTPLAHGFRTIRPNPPASDFVVVAPKGHPLLQPSATLQASRLTQTARLTISALPCFVWSLASGTCLLALTAFNHPQGLGIAGLGITAVIVWRLIEWKRSALWWLIGGMILINALFLWLYHRPPIIETYRAQAWLNAWYGFNILDLSSPAGDRMLQIVSIFGLMNIALGVIRLRRGSPSDYLTVVPFLALLLPCLTIPFAKTIGNLSGEVNIITFQRLLLAAPVGLAIVSWVADNPSTSLRFGTKNGMITRPFRSCFPAGGCICISAKLSRNIAVPLIIALLVVLPSSTPIYSRVWHTIAASSVDVRLRDIIENRKIIACLLRPEIAPRLAYTRAVAAIQSTLIDVRFRLDERTNVPATTFLSTVLAKFGVTNSNSGFGAIHSDQGTLGTKVSHAPRAMPVERPLISACNSAGDIPWTNIEGSPPVYFKDHDSKGTTVHGIQNATGLSSALFTSELIPINRQSTYQLELTVRHREGPDGIVYLAVAWYDSNERFLPSGYSAPDGADFPEGWSNGTYSYFGLIAQSPPSKWSTYSVLFGLGELHNIPNSACFLRLGALLNYRSVAGTIIQLKSVQLKTTQTPHLELLDHAEIAPFTSRSLAAVLSNHWQAQQELIDRGGIREIRSVVDCVNNKD